MVKIYFDKLQKLDYLLFYQFISWWLSSINEMAILSKGCKPDNFELHNSLNIASPLLEVFDQILLNVNLSLNQTLPTLLLYVRHTWMTQVILAIPLCGVIFL